MSKEQPPDSELTRKLRETISHQRYEKGDKELQVQVREVCDCLDRSEARYEDVTGGMMKKQVELIQEIATLKPQSPKRKR